MKEVPLSVFLAPLFMVFELVQIFAAERLLGVKQILAGGDPRQKGPGEWISALWAGALLAEGAWLMWMLTARPTRMHAICLLLIWLIGFGLRNHCPLKRVLVILTFEGALRLGLMVSLLASAWRAL